MRGGDAGRYTAHRAVSNGQKAAFAKVAKKAPLDARVHDTEEKNPAGLPRGNVGPFQKRLTQCLYQFQRSPAISQ
jgi:hypothetical protein